MEDEAVYFFIYLDNATFTADFLGRIFPESSAAGFASADEGARGRWVSYLKAGNQPSTPTAYIRLY